MLLNKEQLIEFYFTKFDILIDWHYLSRLPFKTGSLNYLLIILQEPKFRLIRPNFVCLIIGKLSGLNFEGLKKSPGKVVNYWNGLYGTRICLVST